MSGTIAANSAIGGSTGSNYAQIGDAVTVTGTANLASGTAAAAFTGTASSAFGLVPPAIIVNKIIWI